MSAGPPQKPRWVRRIGWLVLLWGASVAVLGLVAFVLRALMNMSGLTT
jgi:hypothetical protein